jgi:hypothetical protein
MAANAAETIRASTAVSGTVIGHLVGRRGMRPGGLEISEGVAPLAPKDTRSAARGGKARMLVKPGRKALALEADAGAGDGRGRGRWRGTRTLGADAGAGQGRGRWRGTRTLGTDANRSLRALMQIGRMQP